MIDKIVTNKFPRELRTFETRVLFIRDIFMDKYSRSDIMESCVKYKLRKSLETYTKEVNTSTNYLETEDALSVLRRMNWKKGE